MKQRLLALTIALTLLLSSLPLFVFATETEVYATRGQVVDMLLGASDDYAPERQRSDIIKGYDDGTLREDQFVTRAEAFVMLNRAFSPLPDPKGHNLRIIEPSLSFNQIPDWAVDDVQQLVKAGIIIGTPDGTLQADAFVTVSQMDTMIRRVWQLFGTNLKDDFYSTVNKDALDSSVLGDTEMSSSAFTRLASENQHRLSGIMSEMISSPQEVGSKEQKIVDFYNSVLDRENRDSQGIQPIKKYLDAIDAAQTIDELAAAEHMIASEMFPINLFEFVLYADLKDSTKYAVYFYTVSPALTKSHYATDGALQDAYIEYLTTLLTLGGEDTETASLAAKEYYAFESDLAANMLEQQEYGDADKIYNTYTMDELSELLPQNHLKQALDDIGLKQPDQVIIEDVGLTKAFAAHYRDEELGVLKTGAKLQLLLNLGTLLNHEFEDAGFEFQKVQTGVTARNGDKEIASAITQSVMSDYFDEIFAERYSSPEIKADIEDMVNSFIGIFKERIKKLTWMSDPTKEKAIKKLDSMGMNVAYPDSFDSELDEIDIVGPQDNKNSYFENAVAIIKASYVEQASMQDKPVDKTEWVCSTFEVNAFYSPIANTITLPAGILQAPFYDKNASIETNLGAIGTVIAHEITHAFDNNGAKFDENGNAVDWWTAEDYHNFQELCLKAVTHYDGYESAPGIENNGELTLSENIADMGGIACALDAMAQLENPDYDAFFRSNAKMWCMTATREYHQLTNLLDVHSPAKLRVNCGLMTSDKFFDTYKITEGDGMYIAPEDRISIW